jgi:autotransporter-associated beta strand protein
VAGSLAGFDLNPVLADTGATFLLDNYVVPVSNRLGGATRAIHLDDFALHLHGHSSTNSADAYVETIGALTYEGAARLQVAPRSATSSKIALVADSLALASGRLGTLSFTTTNWDDRNGLFLVNAPTLTNGILSPGAVVTNSRDFVTLRTVTTGPQTGLFQTVAYSGYTSYTNPGVWTPGAATEVSRLLFNDSSTGVATLAADVETYALKIDNTDAPNTRGIDLSGRRLTIGSGGLIIARNKNEDIEIRGSAVGSELAFGAQTAYVYAHGSTSSASTIFAPISGSGGFVKNGPGGLLLAGTNTFTGGVFINEGTLSLSSGNHLNNQLLTVAPGATLAYRGSVANNVLGGLAGGGTVSGATGQGAQTLRLQVDTGQSHSFSGSLLDGGGSLSLVKTGAGTQIFDGLRAADSAGAVSLEHHHLRRHGRRGRGLEREHRCGLGRFRSRALGRRTYRRCHYDLRHAGPGSPVHARGSAFPRRVDARWRCPARARSRRRLQPGLDL